MNFLSSSSTDLRRYRLAKARTAMRWLGQGCRMKDSAKIRMRERIDLERLAASHFFISIHSRHLICNSLNVTVYSPSERAYIAHSSSTPSLSGMRGVRGGPYDVVFRLPSNSASAIALTGLHLLDEAAHVMGSLAFIRLGIAKGRTLNTQAGYASLTFSSWLDTSQYTVCLILLSTPRCGISSSIST